FWDRESYSAVKLLEEQDVISKIGYVLANRIRSTNRGLTTSAARAISGPSVHRERASLAGRDRRRGAAERSAARESRASRPARVRGRGCEATEAAGTAGLGDRPRARSRAADSWRSGSRRSR